MTITFPTLDHRCADVGAEDEHHCGCTPYLCPVCNPRRSLMQAIRDVSATRDMALRFFEPRNVIPLHPAVRRERVAG